MIPPFSGPKTRARVWPKVVKNEKPAFGHGELDGEAVHLRLPPFDGKDDRRGQHLVKVVSVMGVLPEVVAVKDELATHSLPEACVELVSATGSRVCGGRVKNVGRQASGAGGAGKTRFSLKGVSRERV